jgi:hypothetical protein
MVAECKNGIVRTWSAISEMREYGLSVRACATLGKGTMPWTQDSLRSLKQLNSLKQLLTGSSSSSGWYGVASFRSLHWVKLLKLLKPVLPIICTTPKYMGSSGLSRHLSGLSHGPDSVAAVRFGPVQRPISPNPRLDLGLGSAK